MLGEDRSDVGHQPLILSASLPDMVFSPLGEEAAFAHFQGFGHRGDGVLAFHLFHQRMACGGISADKMPNAFFKMSLCWRR